MESIQELFKVDFASVFLSVFVVLAGLRSWASLLEWIVGRLGLETGGMRKKREEHELLVQTSQNLAALQEKQSNDREQSDARDEEISNDIKKLTRMFVDKQIDDMRWEINNFAAALSQGQTCSKDCFQHCIHVYEKYEKILEENGLENGEVELSMGLINDIYRQKLKEGF